MPVTKQDFAKLVALQEQDKLIDAAQAALDLIPQDIAALKADAEAEKNRFNSVKERATQLQLKKKEKELELAKHEEAARKHGVELNSVKTNEAFKALQTQINQAKAAAGELETGILEIMEESDKLVQEEKAVAVEVKKAQADIEAQIKVLEGRKEESQAKLAAEKSRRESLLADIPADLLKLYEETRKRRKGLAISKIRGNMCDVCHITLPPQVVLNVSKGTKVLTCESCQRILYSTEAPQSQPKEPAA